MRPKPPPLSEITPETVSSVPLTSMVLFAPSETAPLKLLVPVLACSVPPFRVIDSAPTTTFLRSNVAPFATLVPAAVVPRPLGLVIASVPALTLVAPLYVFAPERAMVPAPIFVKPPAPLITPE